MNTKLTREERELSLTIEEVTGECICYTTIQKYMTKLKNRNWTVIKTECYDDGSIYSMTFKVPEKYLSFRMFEENKQDQTKKIRKPMSEEHKKKLIEARKRKNKTTSKL